MLLFVKPLLVRRQIFLLLADFILADRIGSTENLRQAQTMASRQQQRLAHRTRRLSHLYHSHWPPILDRPQGLWLIHRSYKLKERSIQHPLLLQAGLPLVDC